MLLGIGNGGMVHSSPPRMLLVRHNRRCNRGLQDRVDEQAQSVAATFAL